MPDPWDFNNRPNPGSNDPYAHKANHDVNQQKLHHEGVPGLWRQISNLLISTAILAGVAALLFLLGKWL